MSVEHQELFCPVRSCKVSCIEHTQSLRDSRPGLKFLAVKFCHKLRLISHPLYNCMLNFTKNASKYLELRRPVEGVDKGSRPDAYLRRLRRPRFYSPLDENLGRRISISTAIAQESRERFKGRHNEKRVKGCADHRCRDFSLKSTKPISIRFFRWIGSLCRSLRRMLR